MPVVEFRVDKATYKARPMDAFTQVEVLAKISPLLASGFGEIVGFILRLKNEFSEPRPVVEGEDKTDDGNFMTSKYTADIIKIIGPLATELSKMPAADRRFIISECLSLCERKVDGQERWEPIWNSGANIAMFKDINEDAMLMIRITLGVVQGTFSRFFPDSLSQLLGALL